MKSRSRRDAKRRDAMAVAAAPYLHAKMSAVEPKLEKPRAAEEHGILVRFVRPSRHRCAQFPFRASFARVFATIS